MPQAFPLRRGRLAAAAIAVALAGTAVAQPQPGPWQAVVSRQVHLRAGPSPSYPIVAVLIPGTPVEVWGCLPNYAWCDVAVDVRRGWVHGVYLEAYARDDHARLPDAGALLGIAIIGFALHEYWHDHYRERPFYGQRDRWKPPPAPPAPGRGVGPGHGKGPGPGKGSAPGRVPPPASPPGPHGRP
jgi:uncharacterized protein YraI